MGSFSSENYLLINHVLVAFFCQKYLMEWKKAFILKDPVRVKVLLDVKATLAVEKAWQQQNKHQSNKLTNLKMFAFQCIYCGHQKGSLQIKHLTLPKTFVYTMYISGKNFHIFYIFLNARTNPGWFLLCRVGEKSGFSGTFTSKTFPENSEINLFFWPAARLVIFCRKMAPTKSWFLLFCLRFSIINR